MFGNATLVIGTKRYEGLSDVLAMSYARVFARTLSEDEGYVIVTLSDGETKLIGYDSVSDELVFGRLNYEYRNN